jgi:hypothetical protein
MQENIEYTATAPADPDGEDARPPWGWRHVGGVILLTLGGAFGLLGIAQVLDVLGSEPADATGGLSVAMAVALTLTVVYGIMLLGIYLFGARRAGWAALGLRPVSLRMMALTTPLMLIVSLAGQVLINLSLAALQGGTFENPQTEALTGGMLLTPLEIVVLLLAAAVLVPITEELFFRGMVYPLLRGYGPVLAVVGSAVLFAAAHVVPLLLPSLFFVGLVWGLLREWSKSVLPSIMLHATQNALFVLAINAALSSGG